MRYPVNYIGIARGYHQGKCLDFGWSSKNGGMNQSIYAVDNGVVYSVEKQPKGGNVIYLKHIDGKCSCYSHLDKVMVKKGDNITLGQQIGTMGATGEVSGNHLHFGLFTNVNVRYKNSTLDPFEYLEVYEGQVVGSNTARKYPIKYHKKEYYVTANSLNVRNKNNLLSKTINTLPKGTKVDYIEKVGSFVKIGENQFVWGSYLSTKKLSKVYETDIINEAVNVRKAPGGKLCKSNTPLSKGTIVAIIERKNGWIKTDKNRWIISKAID